MKRKQFGLLIGVGVAAGVATFCVARTLPAMAGGRGVTPKKPKPNTRVVAEPIYEPDTPANRKLHAAVARGNLAAVKAALEAGGDPQTRVRIRSEKESGFMPVFGAAIGASDDRARYVPIFRTLVQHVRDVNAGRSPSGETLLMMAVSIGDLTSVESLVERGATVDSLTPVKKEGGHPVGGETAFYQAIGWGGAEHGDHIPIAFYLLSKGANINHVCADGSTALMRAAQLKKADLVRRLLDQGADPSLRDIHNFTALRWASIRGADDVVALVEKRTPMNLWEAAAFGNAARVKELLAAGANPNEPHPIPQGIPFAGLHAEPPLTAAAKSDDPATVQALLDAGADARYAHPQTGKTALHIAATYGSTRVIPLLVLRGADVNANAIRLDAYGKPEDQHGWSDTPLVCATERVNPEVVTLLLKSGVKLASHDQGNVALRRILSGIGTTPNRLREQRPGASKSAETVAASREVILATLIAAGVDLDRTGALVIAVRANQPDLVRYLLAKGASPNAHALNLSDDDETALMAAVDEVDRWLATRRMPAELEESEPDDPGIYDAEQAARDCLTILLEAGADVNEAARETGVTPLTRAVEHGLFPVAEDLLKRGAVLEATDLDGRTALLRFAAESDNIAAVRWLLQKGADPNHADKNGYNALMLAVDDGTNARWEKWQELTARSREEERQHMRAIHGVEAIEEKRPNPDGHPDVVKLLLKFGADKTAVAKDGKTTALSLARKNGFKTVEALLKMQSR